MQPSAIVDSIPELPFADDPAQIERDRLRLGRQLHILQGQASCTGRHTDAQEWRYDVQHDRRNAAMVQHKVCGAAAPDTLEGPWEQAAINSSGSLNLLKGYKMLSMQYKASAASYVMAVKLARSAIPRL